MEPTTLLMARFVMASALLAGTVAVVSRGKLRIDRRGLLVCLGAGVATGVGLLAFFWSLVRLDASVASVLFSLHPLVVLGLLALRGEKFTYRNILRVALGLSGLYLLIGPGGQVDWLGVALVFVSVWAYSIHVLMVQSFSRDYDTLVATFYVVAGNTAVILASWLVEGAEWHDPGRSGWMAIIYLAVFGSFLMRLTMIVAVRGIGGGQMAMLTPLETLLTVTWSLLFLREHLALLQWMGGALVLFSALLAVRRLGRVQWPSRWRVWGGR